VILKKARFYAGSVIFIFVLMRSRNATFGSFVSQMLVRTFVWILYNELDCRSVVAIISAAS